MFLGVLLPTVAAIFYYIALSSSSSTWKASTGRLVNNRVNTSSIKTIVNITSSPLYNVHTYFPSLHYLHVSVVEGSLDGDGVQHGCAAVAGVRHGVVELL